MDLLYLLPGAFFAPIIHEWVKALCSTQLGDPTPKNKGFLTPNPLKYFEPIGFFLMLAFGFGWGQPVPISPMYYKDRRRGVLLTHTLPMLANLLVGVIAAVLLNFVYASLSSNLYDTAQFSALFHILYLFARCNIGLAFFNLIPVYPLDGARILQLFLQPDAVAKMNHYEKPLQMLLIIMLLLGFAGMLLNPLTDGVLRMVGL